MARAPRVELSDDTVSDPSVSITPAADRLLSRGSTIGRYVILEKIGSGGMGVVYAAFDPELDRKVALKRLHGDRSTAASRSMGRSRLLREAQAMARLSHPNVVTVHDVGVFEDRVFLAMEYVDGQTLRGFLDARGRPWRDALRVMIAAGRGLAAAHAAGLIHRDFKPDNVLISGEGDVKVTDFGLARHNTGKLHRRSAISEALGDASRTGPNRTAEPAGPADPADPSLTQDGVVLGTPAYMSPEQHFGLPTDPRSDQFSFCVVVYMALYGEHPFEERGAAALAVAVADGRVREAPTGTKVPGWLREVVLRGLAPEAEARHPSMDALLAALSADPTTERRRRVLWLAAGATVVAGGITIASLWGNEAQVCEGMDHHLEGVWDDAVRTRVHQSLVESGVGFAQSTFDRVDAQLDAYTVAWTAQRRESCEATQVRGEQSQILMDLRMECLDARLEAVRSVVTILSDADATVTQNAVTAVTSLPDLERCADTTALRAAVAPPDPATADEVTAVRTTIQEAHAHETTGKFKSGLELAHSAVEPARATEYPLVVAGALHRRGRLEHKVGDHEAAEASLVEAFFVAVEHHLDAEASQTAAELVDLVGTTRARPIEGRNWAAHARVHADAAKNPRLRATAIEALSRLVLRQGELDEARALATEAMEVRLAADGADSAANLGSLNLLGLIASEAGQYDDARQYFERALELGRKVLGPDHPNLASGINNLAKIAWHEGNLEEAARLFERALELLSHALGTEHRDVAQVHNNLAAVAVSRGELAEAQRRFELALGIWKRVLGPDHPQVANGLNNMAVVASRRGNYEEARDFDERALALRRRTMAPDHPDMARGYNNLAEDVRKLGELERALQLHQKALEIWEDKLGPDHNDVAHALTGLGIDLVALDRADEAVPHLERALKIRTSSGIDDVERSHSKWGLARALWEASPRGGRDRVRARTLAQEALATYEARAEKTEALEVRTWLDSR